MSPRLKAVYLAAIAVGVFFLPAWWMVGAVGLFQLALWFRLGIGLGPLVRQFRKLALFLIVILVAYSLVENDPATDQWHTVSILGWLVEVQAPAQVASPPVAEGAVDPPQSTDVSSGQVIVRSPSIVMN